MDLIAHALRSILSCSSKLTRITSIIVASIAIIRVIVTGRILIICRIILWIIIEALTIVIITFKTIRVKTIIVAVII